MTYGLLDVAKDLLSGNLEYVQSHIRDARSLKCMGCSERQKIPGTSIGRCGRCGCFMDAKVMLARAECPLKRWEK